MSGVPKLRPLGVNAGCGGPLAHPQAGMLIRLEEPPELHVVVARQTIEPASEITPQHGSAADQHRVCRHAIERDCQIVERRRAHEILSEPGPNAPGPDTLLTRAL